MFERYFAIVRDRKRLSLIGLCILLIGLVVVVYEATQLQVFSPHAQTPLTSLSHTSNKRLLKYLALKYKRSCSVQRKGFAHCTIDIATDATGKALTFASPKQFRSNVQNTLARPQVSSMQTTDPYASERLHTAYNLPCTPGGNTQEVCSQPNAFGPSTIAIVEAFDDPTIESDLNIYDFQYGLPSCTKANGCLSVVNQTGGSQLPGVGTDWILEASMDVQTAHTICQTCKILVVEANDNGVGNLTTAVNYAATTHPASVSMSFSTSESFLSAYQPLYDHPGVALIAASGDACFEDNCSGSYGIGFPASLPTVIAAGGTSLSLNQDFTYNSENVWDHTGSGCSKVSIANSWQHTAPNWNSTGCGAFKGSTDISADADPSTGVMFYGSPTGDASSGGWYIGGGTSLSAPIIAATFGLANSTYSGNAEQIPYLNYSTSNFHDVMTGTNGTCNTAMCKGQTGYDGPTGVGTPNGLGGFRAPSSSLQGSISSAVANTTLGFPGAMFSVTVQDTSSGVNTIGVNFDAVSANCPVATPGHPATVTLLNCQIPSNVSLGNHTINISVFHTSPTFQVDGAATISFTVVSPTDYYGSVSSITVNPPQGSPGSRFSLTIQDNSTVVNSVGVNFDTVNAGCLVDSPGHPATITLTNCLIPSNASLGDHIIQLSVFHFTPTFTVDGNVSTHFTLVPANIPTPTPTNTPSPTSTLTLTPRPTNTPVPSSPTSVSSVGDINGDGHVDVADLSILADNFGLSGTSILNGKADINNDTHVDVLDLSILSDHFGQ